LRRKGRRRNLREKRKKRENEVFNARRSTCRSCFSASETTLPTALLHHPPHLVRLLEAVVDPEEAKGPARGLVALAAHDLLSAASGLVFFRSEWRAALASLKRFRLGLPAVARTLGTKGATLSTTENRKKSRQAASACERGKKKEKSENTTAFFLSRLLLFSTTTKNSFLSSDSPTRCSPALGSSRRSPVR